MKEFTGAPKIEPLAFSCNVLRSILDLHLDVFVFFFVNFSFKLFKLPIGRIVVSGTSTHLAKFATVVNCIFNCTS